MITAFLVAVVFNMPENDRDCTFTLVSKRSLSPSLAKTDETGFSNPVILMICSLLVPESVVKSSNSMLGI